MQKEVELVREKIRLACDRAGRDSETVLLLGVSKTKPYSALQEAYSYGIHDFGENKVQEIRQKYEMMLEDSLMKDCPPRFHMIGTLQKNKLKKNTRKRKLPRKFFWKLTLQRKKANPAFLWKNSKLLLPSLQSFLTFWSAV